MELQFGIAPFWSDPDSSLINRGYVRTLQPTQITQSPNSSFWIYAHINFLVDINSVYELANTDNQKLKIGGHIQNMDSNYQVWWEKFLQAEKPQDNQNRSINKEPCLTLDPFPFYIDNV